jgi:hypothetical protein
MQRPYHMGELPESAPCPRELITPENSPLPTLESTRLLARQAVAVALAAAPMPTWRGGPV